MKNYIFTGTQKITFGKLTPSERFLRRKFEVDSDNYYLNVLVDQTKNIIHKSATKIELIGKIYEVLPNGQIVNEQKVELTF